MRNFKKKAIRFVLTTNYCWSCIFASLVGAAAGYYVFREASDWCWWIVGAVGLVGMVGVALKMVLEEADSCGLLESEDEA